MIGFISRAYTGLKRAISRRFEKRGHLADPVLAEWFSGSTGTSAGTHVTEDTALNMVAVYACVRIIAETLASLPLNVYRRLDPRGKEIARDHHLFEILHNAANPLMSAFSFREALIGHLVLRGNAFAEVQRNGGGEVVGLWPLHPDCVEIRRTNAGTLVYGVRVPGEQKIQQLSADRVLHLRGFSSDGLYGFNPVRMARESLGLAMAAEEHGARLFGNGSKPGGILKHPGKLSFEAKENIKSSWEEKHSGLSNAHRVAVLSEGMEWQQVGITPEDAQLLQTRRFQLAEIARLFRVPLHLLQDLENASYATVEQQGIDFAVHTIRPWATRIEQDILRQLFTRQERQMFFAEHVIDGLLRGDIASRYTAYATARQWGWMSIDDIRSMENMNPLPDGRGADYVQPLNMQAIPAGGLAALAEQGVEPASSDEDDGDDGPRPAVEPVAEAPRVAVEG